MNTGKKHAEMIDDGLITSLKLTVCKKVCNECPFSRNSAKGWLGSHTVDSISEDMRFERLLSCHKQRKEDLEKNQRELQNGTQNVCRGFMLSAYHSAKLFGSNPITGQALKDLMVEILHSDQDEEELKNIMPSWEFKEHHTLKTYDCGLCGKKSMNAIDFETDLNADKDADILVCEVCYDEMDIPK